jgi:hypothetical protein
MRLFNLDLHISVIEDVKWALNALYGSKVEVTNWSISGHNWVFGKPTPAVEHVNQNTWHQINMDMIKAFQTRYDEMLRGYDGFIVTHTPVFCMLYEKYGKPVILVNSCRYEQPFCWTGNVAMWSELNGCLQRMSKSGQLLAVSNNKADQAYLLAATGVSSAHIPSLCLYTGASYNPKRPEVVVFGDRSILPAHPLLVEKPKEHTWRSLYEYKAIVHLPYEVSTMSLFEQVSAGIPVFLPTRRFLEELMQEGKVQLISRYARQIPESLMPFYVNMDRWLDLADWNDWPFVYRFDSFKDLFRQLEGFSESEERCGEKRAWLFERRMNVLGEWQKLTGTLMGECWV